MAYENQRPVRISPSVCATATALDDIIPPHHELVVWTHVDTGSNTHIVNNAKFLHNYVSTPGSTLGQVSGDRKAVAGKGDWHIKLKNKHYILENVLCMPSNPTCTISTGALKRSNHFLSVPHDTNHSLILIDAFKFELHFTVTNKYLRIINGLDYIPIKIIHPPLLHAQSNTTIRRSTRIRKPSRKVCENRELNNTNNCERSGPSPPAVIPLPRPDNSNESPSLSTTLIKKASTEQLSESDRYLPEGVHTQRGYKGNIDKHGNIQLLSYLTHLKFGCKNMTSLIHMSKNNVLEDMPKTLTHLNRSCPICLKCKTPKLPKQPTVSVATLRPGQMMQIDFAFYNCISVRGFTSYLACDCVRTGYSYRFLTRSKRPPCDLIKWLIHVLRKQNRPINFIRFDEGGELARSTEINQVLLDHDIVMQTTGGYASHLNGRTERGHRTDADSVRAMLFAAGLENKYWCFALMYHQFIKRRWCNYPQLITPYELWHDTKPSFKTLHVFGATMYIHQHQRQKLDHTSRLGKFLGYGSSTAIKYYLDWKTRKIKRAHHARIDDFSTPCHQDDKHSPSSILLQSFGHDNNHLIESKFQVPHVELTNSPFSYETLFSYNVELPASGPLGLTLENDNDFGLPIIVCMTQNSCFRRGCKKVLTSNSWIVSIQHDEPITKERVLEYIEYLRKSKILHIQVTLTKRINSSHTRYEEYRCYFDNVRPITSKATYHVQLCPESKYAIQCPTKPPTPQSWTDIKNSSIKDQWYQAIFERYDKNYLVGLLSIPVPRKDIPPDATVLRAVSVFKVKSTASPTIFELYYRMCANGSTQIQGVDYEQSHSPNPLHWSIRLILAISASLHLRLFTIDIDNAFQNTPRYPEGKTKKAAYITMPPLYLQWLKNRCPHIQIQGDPPYVCQCFMNMQGMRPAGHDFNVLIKSILAQMSIYPTSVDNGVYVFPYKTSIVILAISTDDILLCTKHRDIFIRIKDLLNTAFGVTYQDSSVIKYLNYNIIQSEFGISLDQTEFISGILDEYIPKNMKVPKTDTPLRTDKQFGIEVADSTPADVAELKRLRTEFRGDFRTIFGKLCHIMKASRPDLSNAINRLGVFQVSPNRLAFQCLYRILYYLKTHINVPLMYPPTPFTESSSFTCYSSRGDITDSLCIPHCLCGHVDISFAPNKEQRHSIGGHVETMNATATDWKTMKQLTCATSATDAETRQYYEATKRIVRIRSFLRQIGVTIPNSSPVFSSFKLNYELPTSIFEDNKGTRDMLAAGKVTSNLKHVDIPLTYLHTLHESGVIEAKPASSKTMFANFLTKQESGPTHIRSTKWITGRKYYPPVNSQHYKELTKQHSLSLL